MANVAVSLAAGRRLHQTGDVHQAEQVYQHVLQDDPHNVEALGLLAIICQDQGRFEEAIRLLKQAVESAPERADVQNNLGIALSTAARPHEALTCFQQAIRLRPDYAEAHNNLGSVFRQMGNVVDAVTSFREAVRHKPTFAEWHNNLGLGLLNADELDQAEASFREAIRLKPELADAHKNLGIALRNQGRLEEAVAAFGDALGLRPDFADALVSLGLALMRQGKLDEAIGVERRALRVKQDFAEGHNNLGIMLMEQGRVAEAREEYRRTLRLKPDYADAHWNYALVLLLLGEFEQGWLEYEWRRKLKRAPWDLTRRPLWDGSCLAGRTILLHTEQGLGDTIQFIRYAALVKRQGATVMVACRESMLGILAGCPGVDRLLSQTAPLPEFDCHAPLMSLPGIFETCQQTIPAEVPYLVADPRRIERWEKELAGMSGYKVGIAWQGDPNYPGDRNRSIPLIQFEPLARMPGVRLLSLQKGVGSLFDEAKITPDPLLELDNEGQAFVDTAAVMIGLDLVITSDTAIAHLAGALGVPVWVALGHTPDWRYLLTREDSLWYPTMRLFRQALSGGWEPVFERIAGALRKEVAATDHAGLHGRSGD